MIACRAVEFKVAQRGVKAAAGLSGTLVSPGGFVGSDGGLRPSFDVFIIASGGVREISAELSLPAVPSAETDEAKLF